MTDSDTEDPPLVEAAGEGIGSAGSAQRAGARDDSQGERDGKDGADAELGGRGVGLRWLAQFTLRNWMIAD
jgi:hypothetical protein